MESVEDCTKELAALDEFIKSDTFRAFQQDLKDERQQVHALVFESVPQDDGELRAREQAMGLYTYIDSLQSWFSDRRAAIVSFLADAKQKQDIES